ncbi:MAG: pseudouridine synthase [Ignavibacteria bacterium]
MAQQSNNSNLMRLNRFISNYTKLSRRKADEYIREGRITINNITVSDFGIKIDPKKDVVAVDGEVIKAKRRKNIYIVLYKPEKTLTTVKDNKGRTTVLDFIDIKEKIFPIGRLDYETTGVVLLTNDGDFANLLMHPRYEIEKKYYAELSKPLSIVHREKLTRGIMLDNQKTKPCKIYFPYEKNYQVVEIILTEGRNRQVRRMFQQFGYFVKKLHRVSYGSIDLTGLEPGQWRYLTKEEVGYFLKNKPEGFSNESD